jgi:hypothetical protein
VYRERVTFKKPPSAQHRLETPKPDYRIRTKAANATVIPLKQRDIPLGRGKGWIGQANWWFVELSPNPAVKPFLRKVRALLDNGLAAKDPVSRGGGRWGGKTDPERNAQVEQAAIAEVCKHYAGYTVKSVEKDNLGWDLEAHLPGKKNALRLEVKGLFGSELQVGLTPREYRAFKAHIEGTMANYRLCVVTRALSGSPKLVIFRFDQGKRGWIDDRSGCAVDLKIAEVFAATISVTFSSMPKKL